MQPTEEQVKKFWEWCGFRYRYIPYGSLQARELPEYPDIADAQKYCLTDPNSCESDYPELDLNSLFKWAVPKVLESGIDVTVTAYRTSPVKWQADLGYLMHTELDPALALFWAIWKVIEGEIHG